MTKKSIYHKIPLVVSSIAITFAITAIIVIDDHLSTKLMTQMTKTGLPNTIFEHKDTHIQMRLFGTLNDYYYLESIHACPCLPEHRQPRPCRQACLRRQDYYWTWSGTRQEFITQFRSIEPLPEQKEPPP